MRKPESKNKHVARDCDIPDRGKEAYFKENLIWILMKDPLPLNENRKPHCRAPLPLQRKYKIIVWSCNLHTQKGVKGNSEGETEEEKKKGSLCTTVIK